MYNYSAIILYFLQDIEKIIFTRELGKKVETKQSIHLTKTSFKVSRGIKYILF